MNATAIKPQHLEKNSMVYKMNDKAANLLYIQEERNKYISTHEIEETKMLLKEVAQIMDWEKTSNVRFLVENIKEQYPDFFVSEYIEKLLKNKSLDFLFAPDHFQECPEQ